jgi:hypothetical protein
MVTLSELELTTMLKGAKFPEDLRKIFYKHGWKVIGYGAESMVANNPDHKHVIKIFYDGSAYTKFVEMVRQHQENKHFPKFGKYARKIPGTNWRYVGMEFLQPAGVDMARLYFNELAYALAMANTMGLDGGTLLYILYAVPSFRKYIENRGVYRRFNVDEYKKHWPLPDEQWQKAIELVYDIAESEGIKRLDMHMANFMQRGNTLVIADPLYNPIIRP